MGERQQVLVVDDDPFTRVLVASVIREGGSAVVADAADVAGAMDAARTSRPTVAVIDLDLGEGPTGMDLAHGLRRMLPSIGIVILSTYSEPRLLGQNLQTMPPGGVYLTKQSVQAPAHLADAIAAAATGAVVAADPPAGDPRLASLSDNQVEVMRLVAAGCSNAEIARRVSMEEASVEKAIARLIKQLDVKADRQQNQRVMIAKAYHEITGSHAVRGT